MSALPGDILAGRFDRFQNRFVGVCCFEIDLPFVTDSWIAKPLARFFSLRVSCTPLYVASVGLRIEKHVNCCSRAVGLPLIRYSPVG